MEYIYSKKAYLRSDGTQQKNYYVKNPISDVEFSVEVTKDQYGSEWPPVKVNKVIVVSLYAKTKVGDKTIKAHIGAYPTLKGADTAIEYYRLLGPKACQQRIEQCLHTAQRNATACNLVNQVYYQDQATIFTVLKNEAIKRRDIQDAADQAILDRHAS